MGLRVFADSELLAALDAVMKDRPSLLVLSELFAATRRGAEFVDRIKVDPTLSNCQIRVLSDAGEYLHIIANRVAAGLLSNTAAPGDPLSPGYNGTRRAQRVRIGDGLTVRIDGNPVTLVDLSSSGAQVCLTTRMRPHQRIRLSISDGQSVLR